MFHTSHIPVVLTNRPLFLSLTLEEAISWDGSFIYEVELNTNGVQATEEQRDFLRCNPTAGEIQREIKSPVLHFADYDPRDFEKDTTSVLCLNPLENVVSFKLLDK